MSTVDLADKKRRFLEDCARDGAAQWTVVMGNEAGDLDSLASSVLLSHFLPHSIALIQTNTSDLSLRPENIYALSHASIPTSSLLYLDELPLSTLKSPYALVDHNVLSPLFPPNPVLTIYDHHTDEHSHPTASPRQIQETGSCVSLIVTAFSTRPEWSPNLADLALGALLIDTGNMKPYPKGKARDTDRAAFDFLTTYLGDSESNFVGQGWAPHQVALAVGEFHTQLAEKKFDVAHLGSRDLLRRDYKEYSFTSPEGVLKVGLASVPLSLADWLGKTGGWGSWSRDCRAWAQERGLALLGVLTSFKDPQTKRRRELVLAVYDTRLERVPKLVGEDGVLELREREKVEGLVVWEQVNNKATRKQVAPVVSKAVQSVLN